MKRTSIMIMIIIICQLNIFSINDSIINADTVSKATMGEAEYAGIKKKVDELVLLRSKEEKKLLISEGIKLFNGAHALGNGGRQHSFARGLGVQRGRGLGLLATDLT